LTGIATRGMAWASLLFEWASALGVLLLLRGVVDGGGLGLSVGLLLGLRVLLGLLVLLLIAHQGLLVRVVIVSSSGRLVAC
jgi:hypothetical protein